MISIDFISDLTIQDIPSEQMQTVADRCGIADVISLMDKLPGLELYIPAKGKKVLNIQYIKENFTGNNTSSIAIHLGIDRSKIKQLVKKIPQAEDEENLLSNEPMRIVARECGREVAIRLMDNFPSYTLYVPKNGFSIVRKHYIERNFTGYNVVDLALKCGVTERYIRKIISEYYASRAQLSFIDHLK